jgi:hypothetical protein
VAAVVKKVAGAKTARKASAVAVGVADAVKVEAENVLKAVRKKIGVAVIADPLVVMAAVARRVKSAAAENPAKVGDQGLRVADLAQSAALNHKDRALHKALKLQNRHHPLQQQRHPIQKKRKAEPTAVLISG